MPKMLQVRNVPDEVHEKLRQRAAVAGMSLSEFVLRELKVMAARPTVEEVLERAARRSSRVPLDVITEIIREEREARS